MAAQLGAANAAAGSPKQRAAESAMIRENMLPVLCLTCEETNSDAVPRNPENGGKLHHDTPLRMIIESTPASAE
jgi:hypothetical protein